MQELSLAGIDQGKLELRRRLEERRITRWKVLPPIRFLFSLFGVQCFPRGELVSVTGKQKCGKTFVCSILMALATVRQHMGFVRLEDEPLHVLWVDTEQSDTTTQDILRDRLARMVGLDNFDDDRYDIFNLRIDNWQDRMPEVEEAVDMCRPDLMILDGVRDVVGDINNYQMAQDTVEQLLHLASGNYADGVRKPFCMVCVLHENKAAEDKTLRGAIGSELQNKCFEQFASEKSDVGVFTFMQTHTRKYSVDEQLKFVVGSDGLPRGFTEVTAPPAAIADDGREVAMGCAPTPEGYKDRYGRYDVEKIFREALSDGRPARASDLCDRVMQMAGISSRRIYERLREEAVRGGVMVRNEMSAHKVYYCLPEHVDAKKQELEFDDGEAPF